MLRQILALAIVLCVTGPTLAQHFELVGQIDNPRGAAGATDGFGASINRFGTSLIVGANSFPLADGRRPAFYVFDADESLTDTIYSPIDGAGIRVGVVDSVGDMLAVATTTLTDPFKGSEGQVHLLDREGTVVHTFEAPAEKTSHFGSDFAMLGDRIAIGSALADTKGSAAGAVYLYDLDGNPVETVFSPNAQDTGFFGNHVASLGEDKFIVSSNTEILNGVRSGVAYIFDKEGNHLASLHNPSPGHGDLFGSEVAAAGESVLVLDATYVPEVGRDIYSVHVFDQSGHLRHTLNATDPNAVNAFAFFSGTNEFVVVGDPRDQRYGEATGVAYVFDSNGNLLQILSEPIPHAGSVFGSSVLLRGHDLYISASAELNQEPGTVYHYRLVPEPTTLLLVLICLPFFASFGRRDLARC